LGSFEKDAVNIMIVHRRLAQESASAGGGVEIAELAGDDPGQVWVKVRVELAEDFDMAFVAVTWFGLGDSSPETAHLMQSAKMMIIFCGSRVLDIPL